MECGVFAIFLLFGALVVGGIVWGVIAAKKRREAMQALAAQLGLSFSREDPLGSQAYGRSFGFLASLFGSGQSGIPGRFGQFGALSVGDSRKASNVLWGAFQGRELMAFDYQYSTGSGKNRTTHHLSAAVVTLGCRFPELVIRPENFFDKIAAVVGFDDIDFESHEFSRRFHVKARERKLAYDIINAGMMDYLLSAQGWSIELDGADAIIWTGRTWKPEDFRSAIAVLTGFLDRVPRFVWKELGEDREAGRGRERESGPQRPVDQPPPPAGPGPGPGAAPGMLDFSANPGPDPRGRGR